MANTQIQSEQIADDAVTSAKIADNPVFNGNESITLPARTTNHHWWPQSKNRNIRKSLKLKCKLL